MQPRRQLEAGDSVNLLSHAGEYFFLRGVVNCVNQQYANSSSDDILDSEFCPRTLDVPPSHYLPSHFRTFLNRTLFGFGAGLIYEI